MTRMCSCPRADFGNGPTRSIPMRSKGTSMMGSGMSGVGGGGLGEVFWQIGQAWQKLFTSASRPGQWKRSRMRCVVFAAPRCPASQRVRVGQLDDHLRLWTGDHKKPFFLPPPLGDTIEQAVLYDKMWERMGFWPKIFFLHYTDLWPVVFQPLILALGSAKGAPSRDLLVDIKEQVITMGRGLTISPTVGDQENGAATGLPHGFPSTATPSRGRQQCLKPRPVSS